MISDLLIQPEGTRLEFKEKVPEPLALAKTACANGEGGTIIIGVEDKDRSIYRKCKAE